MRINRAMALVGVAGAAAAFTFFACGDDADADGDGRSNDHVLGNDDFEEYFTDEDDGGKTFRFATYEVEYPDGTHCRVAANGEAVALDCDHTPG